MHSQPTDFEPESVGSRLRPVEDHLLNSLCPEPPASHQFYRAWIARVIARSPHDAMVLHQYLILIDGCDLPEATRQIAAMHQKHYTHFTRVLRRLRADAAAISQANEGKTHGTEKEDCT